MKTLKELAQEALQVQDACNPLGVSNSFSKMVPRLRSALEAEKQFGKDVISQHPIFRLWVSKLHDMGDMGLSDPDRFHEAYEACNALADTD